MGPASYQFGFAPRDGISAFPNMWRGCIGAFNPGLGNSGLVMLDHSGRRKQLALIGGASITLSGQRPSLLLGSPSYASGVAPKVTKPFSFSAWINSTSTGIGRVFWLGNSGSVLTFLSIKTESGQVTAQSQISGTAYESSLSFSQNAWTHIAAVWNGNTVQVFRNGFPGTSVNDLHSQVGIDTLWIGAIPSFGQYFAGRVNDILIYDRALSAGEISQLAMRPGVAYELASPRRASSGIAFNRRRRLLVGAGS